jgi:hypothetical protein
MQMSYSGVPRNEVIETARRNLDFVKEEMVLDIGCDDTMFAPNVVAIPEEGMYLPWEYKSSLL